MVRNETPLEMAERHLAEQAARIANQWKLIGQLEADGHSTLEAERFLEKKMHQILVEMQGHRDFIRVFSGQTGFNMI